MLSFGRKKLNDPFNLLIPALLVFLLMMIGFFVTWYEFNSKGKNNKN